VCVCVLRIIIYRQEFSGFDWFCDLAGPRRRVRHSPSAGRQTENLIMEPNRTGPNRDT